MARIRTARVLAAVSALPLAAALFTGVAGADDGALAGDGSIAGVTSLGGSGVGRDNGGNVAQVNGSDLTALQQGTENVAFRFTQLW
ncbi:hypothetical protein [Streptomyces sp. NPDC003720]|jgi:hypothetical protein|uniref:hypothetical protein n=1 Tax=Streptomyces sp. NPDC003720 TaxID=3364684 RepID=UPI0036861906